MTASRLIQAITGKNVVFITVKNRKYIRVSQIECSLFWYRTSPSGNRHNPQGLCSYSGKGQEWLMQTDPEALHKDLMAEYKRICPMTPLRELPGITQNGKEHVISKAGKDLTPDQLRQYYNSERFEGPSFKKLTFNGWFLPPKKKLKIITPLDTPWATYRQKYILLFEPATGKGNIVKRDNGEFFKCLVCMLRMCAVVGSRKQDWDLE